MGYLAGNINAFAAALEREKQRLAQYLADLSHELRTPITKLRGYREGLEDGVVKADAAFFKLMGGESSHLTALSRTIKSIQPEFPHPTDDNISELLVSFLMKSVARWGPRFEKRSLSIALQSSAAIAGDTVAMSVSGLCQIIDNLLSNMLQYASRWNLVLSTFRQAEVQEGSAYASAITRRMLVKKRFRFYSNASTGYQRLVRVQTSKLRAD